MTSDDAIHRQRYSVFGLTIESDIAFPELPATQSPPDLRIARAQTALDPDPQPSYQFNGGRALFDIRIADIMQMRIENGASIRYSRVPATTDAELRLFLLGSGLGAALMQRGQIVIHANAVVPPGRQTGAILCMGASGVGKSTLAYALAQAGAGLISDDVCAIGQDGRVQPGLPKVKLWEHAAGRLGVDTAPLDRVRPADAKFHVPLQAGFCAAAQPILGAFWLEPGDVDRVSVTPVDGPLRFAMLRSNVYRPEFLQPLGLEEGYVTALSQLASAVPMFQVARPTDGFEIGALVEAILATAQTFKAPAPMCAEGVRG